MAASSRAPTFSVALNRRTLLFALLGLIGLVLLFTYSRCSKAYIPAAVVWTEIQREAPKYGLDPLFVFNIAFAESSLNAHANTGYARGLMQMSYGAWSDRTERPYEEAFNWRINLQVAMQHFAFLKEQLEKRKRFSTAHLALAYHRGLNALVENEGDLSHLTKTRNEIYQKLFAGQMVPLTEFDLGGSP